MSTAIVDQIYSLLGKDDIPGAVELARRAYLNNQFEPIVLNLVAHGLEEENDLEGALRVLGEAAERTPNDPMTYTNIGHCLVKLARPTHALEAFNVALRSNPNLPRAHYGAGLALWMRGELAAADEALWRAVKLDPNYPEPYSALALSYAQKGDEVRSRELTEKALSLNPNEVEAQLLVGERLTTEGKLEDSAALFRRLLSGPTLPPLQQAAIHRRLGIALDRLKQYPDAFEAYRQSKLCERRVYRDLFEADDIERQPEKLARLADYFRTAAPVESPAVLPPDTGSVREHVFLMSFPRSGTTLLEQVLASHPDITALEEQPTLVEPINHFFEYSAKIPELMNASEADLQPWRDLYWQHVAKLAGDVSGRVFVDKQPGLTPYIPMLKRMFPQARILFCIRDPRDVVLSCFRHGFKMNSNMYEYTDVVSLAELYCRTMELAAVYFDKVKMPVYMHQHEAFVADFETRTRAMCDFLNVEYDTNMQNFTETAKARVINTPSRDQVREGLNSRGVAYWRNYEAQMAETNRILAPWVKAYGYAD